MKINLEIKTIEKDGNYLNTSYRIIGDNGLVVTENNCSINKKDFRFWYNFKFGEELLPDADIIMEYPSEITDYMYSLLNIKFIGMYWEQQKFISELKNDIHNIINHEKIEELLADKKPMQKAKGKKDQNDKGINREAV